MADIWVGTGSPIDATHKNTVVDALASAASGDRILVLKNHSETVPASQALTLSADPIIPVQVIGVNETAETISWTQMRNSTTGVTAGMPVLNATAGSSYNFYDGIIWRGIRFSFDNNVNIRGSNHGGPTYPITMIDCEVEFPQSNPNWIMVWLYTKWICVNTWINPGTQGTQSFYFDGLTSSFYATGGGIRKLFPGGNKVFRVSQGREVFVETNGFDYNGVTPIYENSTDTFFASLNSCNLTGVTTLSSGGGLSAPIGSLKVRSTACYDSTGLLPIWEMTSTGEAKSDSSTRTGGGFITRLDSNSRATRSTPFSTDLCSVQIDTTANRTITIYLATPSGTSLSSSDIAAEVKYSGGVSGSPSYDATYSGTLTADTSTWSLASGYTPYKMTVPVQSSALGSIDEVVVVKVLLNLASTTVYIDTKVGVV